MKKIIIAGGSGFLGHVLASYFAAKGFRIVILSRHHRLNTSLVQYVKWDAKTPGYWVAHLEGAEALINLNGKSVDCRYNERNKQLIYDTRIEATYVLGQAIAQLQSPPTVWINAASATIYRHALDREMNEVTGEFGQGFSVDVCQKWEETFMQAYTPQTRKVALRIAIVLGKNGGALRPLKNLAQVGIGGRQGRGDQYFSWLHEMDFARIVEYIIGNEAMTGVLNASSPNPVPNSEVMKAIRKRVGMPVGLPMPEWLLSIGAWMIRTETELILKSRRVGPSKLLESGFEFCFPYLNGALEDLVNNNRSHKPPKHQ